MFTGLIRHLGTLEARSSRPGGARLRIAAPADLLARAELGASIAVNGVCLTSVSVDGRAWEADLSEETLEKTTLGGLPLGAALHLEPALCVGDPLDGHQVSGHVDGIGQLVSRPRVQGGVDEGIWRFSMPMALAPNWARARRSAGAAMRSLAPPGRGDRDSKVPRCLISPVNMVA